MNQSAAGSKPGIVVFDVCDTLYASNTTFDFIRFVLQQEKKMNQLLLLSLLTLKMSPVFIGLHFWQKLVREDVNRRLAVRLLKGMLKSELFTYGIQFAEQYLEGRKIARTNALVQEFKKKGDRILFFSGSLEPVIAAVAYKWNVEYSASVLEFDTDSRFTGRLVKDLSGRKLKELADFVIPGTNRLTVVTDNLSDMDLARAADKSYIIVKNEKAKTPWKGLNPEFICLPNS